MIDTIAAIITVDGAWLDIVRRKLATPPAGSVRYIFTNAEEMKIFNGWIERPMKAKRILLFRDILRHNRLQDSG